MDFPHGSWLGFRGGSKTKRKTKQRRSRPRQTSEVRRRLLRRRDKGKDGVFYILHPIRFKI